MGALTERGKVCRVGQNHNPVVILRGKLGSPGWLGKHPPCSWLFSQLLRHCLWGARFFLSCLGEGQKENRNPISSVSGPRVGLRGNGWMVSICFANMAEVKIKIKTNKQTNQLFKKEGKNLQGTVSRQEPMAAWHGCAELSAGKTAGPHYVTGLPGARSATGPGRQAAWRVGPCFPGRTLPLKMEASLLCPVTVPARCRATLCWGKFGYRVFLSDHTRRKPQEKSCWLL